MSYEITSEDKRLLNQSVHECYVSLELLNNTYKTINTLNGNLISDSFTIDATSDIRRTYTLNLIVSDASFNIGENTKIWLDKYLKIKTGVLNLQTGNINWTPMGIYLFTDTNYKYDVSTKELDLTCVDLMAKLTGLRNGQLTGLTTTIGVGNSIRQVMIDTLTQLGGFTQYNIYDTGYTVPYDLSFSTNSTVYDILSTLANLYSGYEIFFDINGTFVFQPLPTLVNYDPILTPSELSPIVSSEEVSNSFSNIKNVTEVWGETIEYDRYSSSVTVQNSNTYVLSFTTNATMTSNENIGFLAPSNNIAGMKIQFVSSDYTSPVYPIVDIDGIAITANKIEANKAYVVRFLNQTAIFLGQNQIHAIYKNTNPYSPYNIYKIGEVVQVFSGGDYEKIYADDLAMQRAEYETYLSCQLKDNTTLTTITVPWIDVNKKVQYTSFRTGDTDYYMLKTIQGSVSSGTMTINMIKYYPLYPDIIYNTTTFTVTLHVKYNNNYGVGGAVIGNGTYSSGTTLTISAVADNGYKFSTWSDTENSDCTKISREITVTSNVDLTAIFVNY
jgi:hypothetical protein